MAQDPTSAAGRRVPRWRLWLRVALGLTLAVAAISLVLQAAGGFGDVRSALGRTNGWWLLPAVTLEGLAYLLSGIRLRRLAGPAADFSIASATELELVVNGLGLLTPASPAEGLAFASAELARRGLPRRRIALTLGFANWFSFRVFYLANALNLLLMLATRDLPVDTTLALVVASVVLLVLFVTAVLASRRQSAQQAAVFLGALRFWKPKTPRDERLAAGARFHADAMGVVGAPRRRVALVALSLGSMLSDVACLWFILIAVGARVDPDVALLSVGAGAVAAAVPLLPAGIGVVEAVMPALIHWYGPSLDAALAGVLLYRVLGTFLPAVAGVASLALLRRHRPAPESEVALGRSDQP